ncbi:hypothetical protein B0J12DRAFT_291471 [Macrophomina phaseolina]|uniref:Secreted protein n=1 Tax=Macrophomina phaseolina TaxID=35725 RepID=A0ABQ8GNM1_9PEZI|nr:hypothetical protein B0J12DRAFT_291471 [Macrophomina phaseolina]
MLIWRLVSPVLGTVSNAARQPAALTASLSLLFLSSETCNASPAPVQAVAPEQRSAAQSRLAPSSSSSSASSPARAACLAAVVKRDDRGLPPSPALHGSLIFAPPSGGRLIEDSPRRARSSSEACFLFSLSPRRPWPCRLRTRRA